MKYISIYIWFILIAFLSCTKEAEIQPKDYPILKSKEVIVNEAGVTLVGEIIRLGNYPIVEIGFTFREEVTSDSTKIIELPNPKNSTGEYMCAINSGLVENQNYVMCSYVKTEKQTIYGSDIVFTSKGSSHPIIADFSPKKGIIGTQIIITGKYFSDNPEKTILKFGDVLAEIISCNDSTIITKVPLIQQSINLKISIESS